MNIGIDTLIGNVGVSLEWLVCMLAFFAGLVFYAKDYKLGVVMQFFVFSLIFMWFYTKDYNYFIPAVFMFLSLILMSFSLFFADKDASRSGFI